MNGNDQMFLDSTKLARALGVSTWVLKGIKIAAVTTGDTPFRGRFSSISMVHAWLEKHPDFVASHHLHRRSKETGTGAAVAWPFPPRPVRLGRAKLIVAHRPWPSKAAVP